MFVWDWWDFGRALLVSVMVLFIYVWFVARRDRFAHIWVFNWGVFWAAVAALVLREVVVYLLRGW